MDHYYSSHANIFSYFVLLNTSICKTPEDYKAIDRDKKECQ
jgi:hypothetical protein